MVISLREGVRNKNIVIVLIMRRLFKDVIVVWLKGGWLRMDSKIFKRYVV